MFPSLLQIKTAVHCLAAGWLVLREKVPGLVNYNNNFYLFYLKYKTIQEIELLLIFRELQPSWTFSRNQARSEIEQRLLLISKVEVDFDHSLTNVLQIKINFLLQSNLFLVSHFVHTWHTESCFLYCVTMETFSLIEDLTINSFLFSDTHENYTIIDPKGF